MNTPRPPHAGPDRGHEDWLAQETALSRAADPRDALLARALRAQPRSRPPADFADTVLRRVQARVRIDTRHDARFERALINGLMVLLALCALGALVLYGGQWWAWTTQALGGDAAQWAAAGIACLGLSAGLRAALSIARQDVPQALA
ncbi:hypothetical protein E2F46_11220 [Luteimonas aestuarii]|uniref:Uncharacterized protein n=1 Tax=Luteimonas aestuarii TaxID=453837 RepID=A0A4R5TTA2_9GAMM|nr:hypothetical protein [Luteimonas aestuarii]TDK23185.1 hypothetical protein E2F46_11220 [Luteimonas aestuarii]